MTPPASTTWSGCAGPTASCARRAARRRVSEPPTGAGRARAAPGSCRPPRHDLPRHPDAADHLVPRRLARDRTEERRLRAGPQAGSRPRLRADRLGDAPPLPDRDGAHEPRSAVRPGGGRRDGYRRSRAPAVAPVVRSARRSWAWPSRSVAPRSGAAGCVLTDAGWHSLRGFLAERVEPDATVVTDGWAAPIRRSIPGHPAQATLRAMPGG